MNAMHIMRLSHAHAHAHARLTRKSGADESIEDSQSCGQEYNDVAQFARCRISKSAIEITKRL